MKRWRIDVEWGIGKVYVMCPIIKNLYTMKVQLLRITKYVHAAALLCHIHTCLEANQNSHSFWLNSSSFGWIFWHTCSTIAYINMV